jgi:uncharacterized protein YbjT (DUF2867 family)
MSPLREIGVLVTGATGYLGRNVLAVLAAARKVSA